MTMKRYGRLLLVLALPLLLAGFLFATFVAPFGGGPFITCEQWDTTDTRAEYEKCRAVGWEGNLHNFVLDQQPAWFDVYLPDEEMDGPLFAAVQGSQRGFDNARIVSAQPFTGSSPDIASFMGSFAGKEASLILGYTGEPETEIGQDYVFLFCNSLTFLDVEGRYESNCAGDGWAGPVTYTLDENGDARLRLLRTNAREEIDKTTTNYRIYQAVTYPLFIYLFLIGSGLIWLGVRAYRFVKAG